MASADNNPPPSTTSSSSQENIVREVSSFYEMVRRAHSSRNAAQIVYPPPRGWPQITLETFACLHKTDPVIELARHLPYFTEELEVMKKTTVVNYSDTFACEHFADQSAKELDEETEDEALGIPPTMLLLFDSSGRNGYRVWLDTDREVVVWLSVAGEFFKGAPMGDVECYAGGISDVNGDVIVDEYELEDWKLMPTFRVASFFAMCKEQFRNMNWMPELEDGAGTIDQLNRHQKPHRAPDKGQALRMRIMREAGWPGDDGQGRGWDREWAEAEMIRVKGDLGT
jgi:hypothetical protein